MSRHASKLRSGRLSRRSTQLNNAIALERYDAHNHPATATPSQRPYAGRVRSVRPGRSLASSMAATALYATLGAAGASLIGCGAASVAASRRTEDSVSLAATIGNHPAPTRPSVPTSDRRANYLAEMSAPRGERIYGWLWDDPVANHRPTTPRPLSGMPLYGTVNHSLTHPAPLSPWSADPAAEVRRLEAAAAELLLLAAEIDTQVFCEQQNFLVTETHDEQQQENIPDSDWLSFELEMKFNMNKELSFSEVMEQFHCVWTRIAVILTDME